MQLTAQASKREVSLPGVAASALPANNGLEKQLGIRKREPFSKRPFDILFSGFGLVMSAWLWALIAILILIEDGFPIFIKQMRIGKNGHLFGSYKFRSMVKSALSESVNIQAVENDPRVTKIGKILRMTAFDELPQLLNIFIGEMSFVGPRALLPKEVEIRGDTIKTQEIPGYQKRASVRPGLTGLAQVYAPRDLSRKHKFKYDILYINHRNIFLDIKLILLSFLVTFTGKWEKRSKKLKIIS